MLFESLKSPLTGSPGAVAQVVEWAGSLIISSEIGSSSLSVSPARTPQGFDGGSEEKRSGSGPLHHSAYQKEL